MLQKIIPMQSVVLERVFSIAWADERTWPEKGKTFGSGLVRVRADQQANT